MYPVFFTIPGVHLDVAGYGVAMMVAFLVTIVWAANRAAKSGANPDVILNCGFIALLGGVLGGRVMYVVHYWDEFMARGSPLEVIIAIVDVRKGGLEVYGGFLAAVLGVFIYLWRWGHSLRWYFDIVAPSVALGFGIGRIGCFLNGCCWGGLAPELPWAVQFPFGSPPAMAQWLARDPGAALPAELLVHGAGTMAMPREVLRASDEQLLAARRAAEGGSGQIDSLRAQRERATSPEEIARLERQIAELSRAQAGKVDALLLMVGRTMSRFDLSPQELRRLAAQHPSLKVHPTQLYAAVALGLLAWMLSALYWRRARDGQVIFTLLVAEPICRWTLEVLRADNPVDTAGLTVSQFIALCLCATGILGLIAIQFAPPRSRRARIWVPDDEVGAKEKSGARPAASKA